jgi:hypothetical protein
MNFWQLLQISDSKKWSASSQYFTMQLDIASKMEKQFLGTYSLNKMQDPPKYKGDVAKNWS